MIAVIDNYDSFTYNLVQHLGALGAAVEVFRNDAVTVEELAARRPEAIVISPGPCTPREAGISVEAIRRLGPTIPLLGVCLGHQCVGEAFGGRVVRAQAPVHGKVSRIVHDGRTIYEGLPSPIEATRYHSLVVAREGLPDVLEVSARLEDGTIMGLRHRRFPVEGVQFHPESVLTAVGKALLARFLELAAVSVGHVAHHGSAAPAPGGGHRAPERQP
ncbi:MAG: aminodeoxychorismate/anthranilate synthase component II [Armatimonadota bacterium]|nr:aminodeoxychorismate/anthranilate synthase component II [Armatimonadota bacterium]MDR7455450.1 aminodeoxychorismate/anthranilate synthase component II [Armatimonadota bacterium]MDR7456805.1 aminodeoxychorismate/anthranilate synthase component II [Armatimonadota bacterium]MDR7497824.1 aminodeoxychorismate/anthranilate synthase component II [Armatimonadota bacterium]MDR7512235.1 aminodeoxychorismate/anthranilate synthase component II [Armatimonadota bacterium]